jgi:hypothetical protein
MKNLIFVFVVMFFSYSVNAQLYLDVKEMITVKDKKKTVENINGKVNINSDTSEIEIKINEITYREKIGRCSHHNDFGDCMVYIYEQEESYMVVQTFHRKLYSVSFQSKNNKLQFK